MRVREDGYAALMKAEQAGKGADWEKRAVWGSSAFVTDAS
jgi:hypothetical protein